jgi:hypothetical protein
MNDGAFVVEIVLQNDRYFRGERRGVLRFAVVNTANYEKGGIKRHT